jgi:hypothetical protein
VLTIEKVGQWIAAKAKMDLNCNALNGLGSWLAVRFLDFLMAAIAKSKSIV